MAIRNQLWEQMKTAYTYELCAQRYLSRKRKLNRFADNAILLLGIIGSLSFLWEKVISAYASIGMTAIAVIKKCIPTFSQPESELNELDTIMCYYHSQFNDLRHLWNQVENEEMTLENANKKLRSLTSKDGEMATKMNKLIRRISKKENKILEKETENFFKANFYTNNK